jgi:prepilin-type N-terminal cleavage/methylation domain-containing protein
MRIHTDESGFTLVELLVGLTLFTLMAAGLYWAMRGTVRGSDTTEAVTRVTEEARLGFNRMIRDTREASLIVDVSSTSYNVRTDFNADGTYQNPNANGDYEDLTFAYNAADRTITLNGQVLMRGVFQVGSQPIFEFTSNLLQFDTNGDGVTSWQELDAAPTEVGNGNGVLDGGELPYLSSVRITMQVRSGTRRADFFAEAQLRNRRQ